MVDAELAVVAADDLTRQKSRASSLRGDCPASAAVLVCCQRGCQATFTLELWDFGLADGALVWTGFPRPPITRRGLIDVGCGSFEVRGKAALSD
jgi:hypothetical protein